MSSIWQSAANEVVNVWHTAQANPFHALCITAIVILGTGGAAMALKDQIRLNRISRENKRRFDRLPHPPKFDPQKFIDSGRGPR